MVNEKISSHRKAYWAAMPAAERTERMQSMAKKRQSKMTPLQKRQHGLMMATAKKAKQTPAPSALVYNQV